jgi:hypothetical protein
MMKRAFGLFFVFIVTMTVSAPWATSEQEGGGIPSFNPGPPAKGAKLPPILGKDQLWQDDSQLSYQTHAYELAAKIPVIIHQQPCYCFCDRTMNHNSLHSCFEGTHGAHCGVCLKELYYSYMQYKKGRTAAQIRKGIIAGEWNEIDLEKAAAIN